MTTRGVLFASVLVLGLVGCKGDHLDELDRAAEEVADQREDLADEQEDVTGAADHEDRAEVAHASAELAKAEVDYEQRRAQALDELRFRHNVYATQTAIARGILADPGLADHDRQEATDKVLTLERELGEAQLAIDALATSTAAQWDSTQVTVDNAFQQLEGAHEDAFDILATERTLLQGDARKAGKAP